MTRLGLCTAYRAARVALQVMPTMAEWQLVILTHVMVGDEGVTQAMAGRRRNALRYPA